MSLFAATLSEVKPSSIPKIDEKCMICHADYRDMREETDTKVIRHSKLIGEAKYLHAECLKSWYERGVGNLKKCVVCQGHDLGEADFEAIGMSPQLAETQRHISVIENQVLPELEEDYEDERGYLKQLLVRFDEVKRSSILYGFLAKDYHLEAEIKKSEKRLSSIRSEISSWESAIDRMKKYGNTSTTNLVKQVASLTLVSLISASTLVFSFNYAKEHYPNPKENEYNTIDYHAASSGMLGGLASTVGALACAYEPVTELASRLWTWRNR